RSAVTNELLAQAYGSLANGFIRIVERGGYRKAQSPESVERAQPVESSEWRVRFARHFLDGNRSARVGLLDQQPRRRVAMPVGRVGEIDRAKPRVARGEELGLAFIRRPLADRADAVGADDFAMDEAAAGIAGESVADVLRAERVAAINRRAGCAGEISRHASA